MRVVFSFGGGLTSYYGAIKAIKTNGFENVDVVNAALCDDEPFIKPVIDAFEKRTGKTVRRITLRNPAIDSVRRIIMDAEAGNQSPQLTRWLIEGAKKFGRSTNSVSVCDEPRYGVWDIFFWAALIGNTRFDPCSDNLKRQTLRRWVEHSYEPGSVSIGVGMTDDEIDRWIRTRSIWDKRGYEVVCPLVGYEWDKVAMLKQFETENGFTPESYALGLSHNNCGGCVKAGLGEWARVLYYREPLFKRWAWLERFHQQVFMHNFTILRDQSGGKVTPLTMYDFETRMREKWAGMNTLPGMEELMFFGLEDTPSCRFCEAAA